MAPYQVIHGLFLCLAVVKPDNHHRLNLYSAPCQVKALGSRLARIYLAEPALPSSGAFLRTLVSMQTLIRHTDAGPGAAQWRHLLSGAITSLLPRPCQNQNPAPF